MFEVEELPVIVRRTGGTGSGPRLVWAFVGLLAAVVGLALVGADEPEAAADTREALASPSGASDPGFSTPPTSQVLLPLVDDDTLDDAPTVVLARHVGDDLELLKWQSGQATFQADGLVRGAFAGMSYAAWVDLSPDGRYGAVVNERDLEPTDETRVRVVEPGGPTREVETLSFLATALVWSPDSSRLVIGGDTKWTIVVVGAGRDGGVSTIRLAVDPGATPLAFSADGRVLYGAIADDSAHNLRPLGVALDAGVPTVRTMDRFPAAGPERFAPSDATNRQWQGFSIDPASGLSVAERLESPAVGPALSGFDIIDAVWIGDRRLLVLTSWGEQADEPEGPYGDPLGRSPPFGVRVRTIEADESIGPPLLSAERVNRAEIVAWRPGFVLFMFQADQEILLVLLRTTDGATSTVSLRSDDFVLAAGINLVDPGPTR